MSSSGTRIGTTIGGYRLESLLGRGGMSVVYLAEHVRLGRKVALKLLSRALNDEPSFRERFERESRRAAEIDHPNIIPIYDAGEADGQLFIAMRHVQGRDLRTIVQQEGPLGVARTLFLLEQAASALDAAHERDLIHRDVKPANILVEEPSDRVYLTDFGVVKHTTSTGLTRTGLFIGTVDYASPEQIEGAVVDGRTDVYALGCVLYECLAGKPPFSREGEVAIMHAHLAEPPPAVSAVNPGLPRSLDRVIATAMAKDKDDRFGTCEEVIDAARAATLRRTASAPALTDAGAAAAAASAATSAAASAPPQGAPPQGAPPPPTDVGDSGIAPPPPPPKPPREPRKRPPWLPAALAALVAAAASAAVVAFLLQDDETPAATEPTTSASSTTDTGVTDTGTTSTVDTATTTAEVREGLAALVPGVLWSGCELDTSTRPGAEAAAVCGPSDSVGGLQPDRWEVTLYPNAASMRDAFDSFRKAQKLQRDSGNCNGVTWGGEGPWLHGPDKPGGRRLCYFSQRRHGDRVDAREARAAGPQGRAARGARGRVGSSGPVQLVAVLAPPHRQGDRVASAPGHVAAALHGTSSENDTSAARSLEFATVSTW